MGIILSKLYGGLYSVSYMGDYTQKVIWGNTLSKLYGEYTQ